VNDFLAWFLSIGAFAAIVVLTAIAAKSFAGDPALGRRRCPRCWHELGPSGVRCTECGTSIATENAATRTRRRPWRGALAMLAILAIGVAARARFLESGPWSVAPTAFLLQATALVQGAGYRTAPWELAQRVQTGLLDDEQLRAALLLAIRGDRAAQPASAAWERKYAPILRAVLRKLPRDEPLLLELLTIPPTLRVQPVIGDGSEPFLSVEVDEWWPNVLECETTVMLPNNTTRRAVLRPDGRMQPLFVPLGAPSISERTPFVVQATIGQRFIGSDAPFAPVASLETRVDGIDRTRGAEIAATLKPVDSSLLRSALEEVFAEGLFLWRTGIPRAGMRFAVGATAREECEGVAFGVVVEMLERGVVRRTSRIWWRGGSGASSSSWLPSDEDVDALERLYARAEDAPADWTMRIRGDRYLAAFAMPVKIAAAGNERAAQASAEASHATAANTTTANTTAAPEVHSYFAGTMEFPLRVTRTEAASPARRWTLLANEPHAPQGTRHPQK